MYLELSETVTFYNHVSNFWFVCCWLLLLCSILFTHWSWKDMVIFVSDSFSLCLSERAGLVLLLLLCGLVCGIFFTIGDAHVAYNESCICWIFLMPAQESLNFRRQPFQSWNNGLFYSNSYRSCLRTWFKICGYGSEALNYQTNGITLLCLF